MGYGNYSTEAHLALISQRAAIPREQLFTQRGCHPLMNPKDVVVRESRDSPEHPHALPIVFALDVTGSMGEIPEVLARRELPHFMITLTRAGIEDPQVMFMAVGDAGSDAAPLQVGQFESTAELMDRWLTFTYLEGRGGGQDRESYELALYFLAQHTELDSVKKRRKRGYAFLTGDEKPYPAVSKIQAKALLGDELDDDVPLDAVVAAVSTSFQPFFLIPDLARRRRCERAWRDVLGDNVVCMEAPRDTCFVAAALLLLAEGVVHDLDALARTLEGAGATQDRLAPTLRAVAGFAGALGRDGAAPPRLDPPTVRRAATVAGPT